MKKKLKSANSAKIGKVFQVARAELGLSKSEVSDTAFVNIRYINAIESGDYSIFPSKVFAKAYFEKYQKFLSIDCDFPKVYEENVIEDKLLQKNNTQINLLSASNIKIFIAAVFIVCIVIVAIVINTNKYEATKSMIPLKEIDSVTNNDFRNVDPVIRPNNLIEANDSSSIQKKQSINIPNKLFISFLDECWIEIYSFDELIVNKLFQYGDNFELEIDKPFKIVVGDAVAVEAFYNGNSIDFIANANRLNVSTIIFDDE